MAQGGPLVLQRDGRVISLTPYAPNILRVTISTRLAAATSDPGYGFVGKPSAMGWTHVHDAKGDVLDVDPHNSSRRRRKTRPKIRFLNLCRSML